MNTNDRIPARDVLAQPRRMGIKNLSPGLVERGKIKIGMKGAERQKQGGGGSYQMPQKLDHFLVTTTERGRDNNFMRDERLHVSLGETPREIPVILIYDDIDLNFQTRYAAYAGKTLWCSGDGETASRAQKKDDKVEYHPVECPCPRQSPTYEGRDKCKINGTLSVMIQGAEAIGGVWKFRTTSYNSVVGILSSLALIKRITGGPLAGIPLMMTLTPKTVQDPIKGSQQTIYVVGLEFRGGLQALQSQGHDMLLDRTKHGLRIEHIEQEARSMLSLSPAVYAAPDDIEDEVDEFYPEAATAQAGDFIPAGESDVAAEKPKTEAVKSGGGAGSLNAAAMASSQAAPVSDQVADSSDNDASTEDARLAGRLTYWIDPEHGDFREIKKGEAIPDGGQTVSKANYEEFLRSLEPVDSPEDEQDVTAGTAPVVPPQEDQKPSGGSGFDLF